MHSTTRIILFLSLILLVSSCKTSEKVLYLQDVKVDTPEKIENSQVIKIEPKDMLSIVVSSSDPAVAKIFNLPVSATQAGTERAGYGNYLLGYVVDNEGYIDFPILGKIKASGLSRWQLQEQITQALAEKKMLTDGLVTVEFMNFKVSILGEVTNPGTYTINSDKVTVLEAIAMAKDLTIFGERDHVYVIREEDGQRKSYQLDLRSADIFKSPAYYLKRCGLCATQQRARRAVDHQPECDEIGVALDLNRLTAHIDRRACSQHCKKRLIRNINTIPHLKITCKRYQAKTA